MSRNMRILQNMEWEVDSGDERNEGRRNGFLTNGTRFSKTSSRRNGSLKVGDDGLFKFRRANVRKASLFVGSVGSASKKRRDRSGNGWT